MGGYAVNEGIVPCTPTMTDRKSAWESQYYRDFVPDPNHCDDATLHVPRPIPDLVRIYGF